MLQKYYVKELQDLNLVVERYKKKHFVLSKLRTKIDMLKTILKIDLLLIKFYTYSVKH